MVALLDIKYNLGLIVWPTTNNYGVCIRKIRDTVSDFEW